MNIYRCWYIKPGIEFNFYVDPEAAFIVFNSTDTSKGDIQPIILVPYESVSERNIISMVGNSNLLSMHNHTLVHLTLSTQCAVN